MYDGQQKGFLINIFVFSERLMQALYPLETVLAYTRSLRQLCITQRTYTKTQAVFQSMVSAYFTHFNFPPE